MIHRYLFDALTLGVQAMIDDPRLLDDLFERNYGLEDSEVQAIKDYFAAKPPTVVNGYARQDTEFPAIAITLSAENEAVSFLGNSGGQIEDEGDPLFAADIESAVWNHTYNILVYTEHPDVTAYYYEICKSIMLAGFTFLANTGALFEFSLSGTELIPDPLYVPEHLFVRQLVFSCQREFQTVDRESRLSKVFQVAGLHVDKSGSPSDVGDVKTLLTTYNPEAEDENG